MLGDRADHHASEQSTDRREEHVLGADDGRGRRGTRSMNQVHVPATEQQISDRVRRDGHDHRGAIGPDIERGLRISTLLGAHEEGAEDRDHDARRGERERQHDQRHDPGGIR